jgi:Alginate export
MGWRGWLWLGVCLPLAAWGEAARPAETADAPLIRENAAWPRIVHDALGLPPWLDLGIEQRTRFEYFEDPWRPGEANTQSQYPQRTRLRLGLDAPAGFRFLAELQDSRTWGDGPNDFIGGEIDRLSFAQLFASYTQRELFGSKLRGDLHVGRMSLDIASRRLVARNSTRNTTNAFDGVHVALGDPAGWRVRGFWVRPVQLDKDYFEDESAWQQRFWGAAYEDKRVAWLNLDVYYLGLDDEIARGSSLERHYHTFGARVLRAPKAGQWDYELEAMGQLGSRRVLRGTPAMPVHLGQGAWAAHLDLGYTWTCDWTPRLAFQFDYASGTRAAAGDTSHSFDPLFGARRFDLVATGIYGPFRRSNILSPGLRLQVVPRSDLKAWLKVRYWQLAEAKDAFSGAGLRDASGDSGDQLGTDVELAVTWTPRPWVTLETGYDHWFKGTYIDGVASPPPSAGAISKGDSDYVYFSVQFRI